MAMVAEYDWENDTFTQGDRILSCSAEYRQQIVCL
jgi:hypothetical protein